MLPRFIHLPVLLGAIALPCLASADTPYIPAPARVMIRALPPAPEGWTVTASTADSSFMKWIRTSATRSFERPASPDGASPAASMRVTVTDTGAHPSALGVFANFQPREDDNVRLFLLNERPAVALDYGETQSLRILVDDRIIVEFVSTGLRPRGMDQWVRASQVGRLARIPKGRSDELPVEMMVTHIDELDPSKNRTYALAVSTQEDIKAVLPHLEQVEGDCPE